MGTSPAMTVLRDAPNQNCCNKEQLAFHNAARSFYKLVTEYKDIFEEKK